MCKLVHTTPLKEHKGYIMKLLTSSRLGRWEEEMNRNYQVLN